MSRKKREWYIAGPGKGGAGWRPRDLAAHWVPVTLWLSFIFLMSTGTFSAENTATVVGAVIGFFFPGLSPDTAELVHEMVRKAAHVTEYFILGLLLFRAFRAPGEGWRWRYALFATVGVALWALGDEFHQSFVATRTASLVDVGIDTTGGILGQLVIAAWYRRFGLARKLQNERREVLNDE